MFDKGFTKPNKTKLTNLWFYYGFVARMSATQQACQKVTEPKGQKSRMDFTCRSLAVSPSHQFAAMFGTICQAALTSALTALKQLAKPTKMSFAIWERRNHSHIKSAKKNLTPYLQIKTILAYLTLSNTEFESNPSPNS